MDIESVVKRMRIQIKHGRTEGVEEKLEQLLQKYRDTEEEVPLLEVYALDYLPDAGLYAQAIPQLERLIKLGTSEEKESRALSLLSEYRHKAAVVPSEVDISNPALLEYLDIIRSGKILKFDADPKSLDKYEVVKDLDFAMKLAWHSGVSGPYKSWNSLREQAAGKLSDYCDENKIDVKPLRRLDVEIERVCEEKLSDVMMNFYDDISADLSEMAIGKALGVSIHLHEEMWGAYQKNAFPCGWNGKYPLGRLCVFIP